MNQNRRLGTVSPSLLATVFVACAAVACTTTEAKPDGGGTGGKIGAGIGGNLGGGTGGSGSTAACGTGPFAPNPGVLCAPPTQMITNFAYDPDGGATDQVRFGTFGTTLSGGQSAYSNVPGTVTGNVTQGDWHIMGSVANYSGFNLYFDNVMVDGVHPCNMVDASAFDGISFTIWGTTGGNAITMGVGILDDSVAPSWLTSVDAGPATPSPGSCIPTSGNGPYYHPGCSDPTNVITVTGTQAAPQTVSLRWTDFTLGMCKANVVPSQILSVYWQLPWTPGAVPYDIDIHIDDLAFIPKP
jgi:hypothetical protein